MSNALVMQSGGNTPAFNSSLYGVVSEAMLHSQIKKVYGSEFSIEGILEGKIHDLGGRTKQWWNRVVQTPGALMGSSRKSLKTDRIETLLDVFRQFDIGLLFIIGGNDSAETGHKIAYETNRIGFELLVVQVPKTIDNDLTMTDHSPGYGSAARFLALATMGAGRDAETMRLTTPFTTIEVMGRDAGWLSASSVLGKREEKDSPHVICVPEIPLETETFLSLMSEAYKKFGFAVAVVSENTRNISGDPFSKEQNPWYVDEFGHPYYEGAGRHLSNALGVHFNTRVRYEKPGTIQRSMSTTLSAVDIKEAEMAGRAAVNAAIQNKTDVMITLKRQPGPEYVCTTGVAPLTDIAGKINGLPKTYFSEKTYMPTQDFVDYATPLIGEPLPIFERLTE